MYTILKAGIPKGPTQNILILVEISFFKVVNTPS